MAKRPLLFICLAVCVAAMAWFLWERTHSAATIALPVLSSPPRSAASDADGLQKEDIVVGTGAEALASMSVTVRYTGMLTDGSVFDSSQKHGEPFHFILGQGEVIPGWDLGIPGMRVGGKRRLIVPPGLAYGDRGAGGVIPPGAILVFDIQLIAAEPAGISRQ